MKEIGRYDPDIKMFVEKPRNLNIKRLRFLRWMVEKGRLGYRIMGPSVISDDILIAANDDQLLVDTFSAETPSHQNVKIPDSETAEKKTPSSRAFIVDPEKKDDVVHLYAGRLRRSLSQLKSESLVGEQRKMAEKAANSNFQTLVKIEQKDVAEAIRFEIMQAA